MRMHAHLLSTQSVLDTFDTGFESTRNRIEIKIWYRPSLTNIQLIYIKWLLLVVIK